MNLHFFQLCASLAGLLVTLRFIRNVQRDAACGEHGYCSLVMQTRQGHTLGVKNTTVGMVYYSTLSIFFLMRIVAPQLLTPSALLIAESLVFLSAGGSVYLLYQLFVVLNMRCPLCITAHSINFALVATYLFY